MRPYFIRFIAALLHGVIALSANAQVPLRLDPSFDIPDVLLTGLPPVTPYYSRVSSMLPLSNGQFLASGELYFPGYPPVTIRTVRLNPDGSRDMTFPVLYAAWDLRMWNDRFYIGPFPRRYFMNGTQDPSFQLTNPPGYSFAPYTYAYDVLPDGSVIIGGTGNYSGPSGSQQMHMLKTDSTGLYDLQFLANIQSANPSGGYASCIKSVSGGRFMISGGSFTYNGQGMGRLVRFHNDGMIDTTFRAPFYSGYVRDVYETPDGKYVVCGRLLMPGSTDSIQVARLHKTGELDTSFDHTTEYGPNPLQNSISVANGVTPYTNGSYIITGSFASVSGFPRGSIAVIDSTGQVIDDGTGEPGCSGFILSNSMFKSLQGSIQGVDGAYYAFGVFLGYSDDQSIDPTQKVIVRLEPMDISTTVHPIEKHSALSIAPNPANTFIRLLAKDDRSLDIASFTLHDLSAKLVLRENAPVVGEAMNVGPLARGVYMATVTFADGSKDHHKVVLE